MPILRIPLNAFQRWSSFREFIKDRYGHRDRFNGVQNNDKASKNIFYLGNQLISRVQFLLNGINLNDPLSGLRVVRAELLRNWKPKSKGLKPVNSTYLEELYLKLRVQVSSVGNFKYLICLLFLSISGAILWHRVVQRASPRSLRQLRNTEHLYIEWLSVGLIKYFNRFSWHGWAFEAG
jgi:hypothetical protein